MAHPLANKGSVVSGTITLPVLNPIPPPRMTDFIRQYGVTTRAFEAFDNANRKWHEDWVMQSNEAIGRTFQAMKENPA